MQGDESASRCGDLTRLPGLDDAVLLLSWIRVLELLSSKLRLPGTKSSCICVYSSRCEHWRQCCAVHDNVVKPVILSCNWQPLQPQIIHPSFDDNDLVITILWNLTAMLWNRWTRSVNDDNVVMPMSWNCLAGKSPPLTQQEGKAFGKPNRLQKRIRQIRKRVPLLVPQFLHKLAPVAWAG